MVNTASNAGKRGEAMLSSYSASKAAVVGFTEALHDELAGGGHQGHRNLPGPDRHPPMADDYREGGAVEMITPRDVAETVRLTTRLSRACVIPRDRAVATDGVGGGLRIAVTRKSRQPRCCARNGRISATAASSLLSSRKCPPSSRLTSAVGRSPVKANAPAGPKISSLRPPHRQQRHLRGAEVLVHLWIELDVADVVGEQLQLDRHRLLGVGDRGVGVGPGIRVDDGRIRNAVRVLPFQTLGLMSPRSTSALASERSRP